MRRFAVTFVLMVSLLLVGGGSGLAADAVIYSEGLAGGWSNWSWSSWVNFNGTSAYGGTQAINWQIAAPWGGLYLHSDSGVQTGSGTALQFALMGTSSNQQLMVSVYGANGQQAGYTRRLSELGGDPLAWQWKAYNIPLSNLGAAGQWITGVVLQDANGWAQPTILVDEIKLAAASGPAPTPAPAPGPGSGNCLGVPAYPEIRWGNASYNANRGRPTDPWKFIGPESWRPYYAKIDGNCVGTTEQILEWAAKKWGFDQLGYPDLAKAMAVQESWWTQNFIGSFGEYGVLQVNPSAWPDWDPAVWSTAYNADYTMAVIRSHYDGASWIGYATKGNIRDSVGAWYCGCPYHGWDTYATNVFNHYAAKPWQRPGQPPYWF